MHVIADYSELGKHNGDAVALCDTRDYLNEEGWTLVVDFAKKCKTADDVQGLNFSLGFAGISGRPFFALCRTLCLDAFKLWLGSSMGGEAVPFDEDGFFIVPEKAA